jgi:alpha-L-fucosidase
MDTSHPFSSPAHDAALATIDAVIARGPFNTSWESLKGYGFPSWYVDGKFGIFPCWGPISVSGFNADWYAREMYQQGRPEFEHHLKTFGKHDVVGYKDLIQHYTMEKFDADEWASLFRRAGAQFVVPIAEYHDGFANYDSAFTPYRATEMGPKRDLVGELLTSCRSVGLTAGCSSHYMENWWFYNGGVKFPSDVQDPAFASLYGPAQREEVPANEMWLKHWLCRTCDFVDKYRPSLVWFDFGIEDPTYQPYLKKFAAYYFNRSVEWGIHVAINQKHGAMPNDVGVVDIERGQLGDITYPFWQTDTSTAKNSWIHIPDAIYKEAGTLIGDLVDIVSKNGALLLNIGPRPDGSIPEHELDLLEQIGAWLQVNGEAIYGTRPWKIYGEGPNKIEEGFFTDTNRPAYGGADIRFTSRPPQGGPRRHEEILYATVLGQPPDDRVLIRSLAAGSGLLVQDIKQIDLLGGPYKLEWTRGADGLAVTVPKGLNKHGFSLRIFLIQRSPVALSLAPVHEHGPSYDAASRL